MGVAALQCLICRVGSRLCALPLQHVTEILRPLPVEAMEGAPPFVVGATVLRGEVVPVLHGGRLLTGSDATGAGVDIAPNRRFVALRLEHRVVVLAVSDVIGTRFIRIDELVKTPALLSASGESKSSLALLDGELLEVLDSARVIERAPDAAELQESA